MNESLQSLSKWFSERPQWMQCAATRLLKQTDLTDQDITELTSLCRSEFDGSLAKATYSFSSSFTQGPAGSLRLCSISDVEGVNTLAPKKPLDFGKGNLAVIYGNNGSGKSGYTRLLKHICGSRVPGSLHRNVYKSGSAEQKACITFEKDSIQKCHKWSGNGICEDLKTVDIFDASFGKIFVSSEDEVSYEPPVLAFFSSLILACEKISLALDAESNWHQPKKPNIPADKKATAECIWYEAISAQTSTQDIDKHCTFSNADETEIQTLQQRLAEQAPAEKAKQLTKQKQHIDTLVQEAQKHLKQLSDENYRRIIAAKKVSILKKTAADTAAEKVFSGSELEGVGSDVWRELWKAARNYSVSTPYKDAEYPNISDGSRCVLCHQTLTQEAKERLISFENFVNGEMQKAATDAAKEFETVSQTVEVLPTSESLKTRIDAAGIPQDEVVRQVLDFFAQLQVRKDQFHGIESEEGIPDPLPPQKWIEIANDHSKSLGVLAAQHEEDAKIDNRDELKKKMGGLLARKWLSENRTAINEEVNRLKLLNQIQKAKASTNTTTLSKKKGELAEVLITDAFVQRFNAELKAIGASHVKVELVKSKVSKGKVLHKIQLRGAAQNGLTDVLSEGENRIVSIAAFLADVTGKNNQTPFVFDDPISSLDQNFEEAVAKRLADLSKCRQVIIFTHRVSLATLIKSFDGTVVAIRTEPWGSGEPSEVPLFGKNPEGALNDLITNRLSKARKALELEGSEMYSIHAKSICSEFRIILERMIEFTLLCDVVQRFRRQITTDGKLCNIHKISQEDTDLFDDLMTKYSKFEHSQSVELPVELPDPEELLVDLNKLKQWNEDFKPRIKK